MKIRILTIKDKDSLMELIKTVEDSLENKEWWLPIKEEESKNYFNSDKILFFGGFIKNKLVGASALFVDHNDFDEILTHLNIDKEETLKLGRSMVHPEYRGKNRMMIINKSIIEYAKKYSKKHFIAIAHPDNIASNKALKKIGFKVVKAIIKDEKYLRNIFLLNLND